MGRAWSSVLRVLQGEKSRESRWCQRGKESQRRYELEEEEWTTREQAPVFFWERPRCHIGQQHHMTSPSRDGIAFGGGIDDDDVQIRRIPMRWIALRTSTVDLLSPSLPHLVSIQALAGSSWSNEGIGSSESHIIRDSQPWWKTAEPGQRPTPGQSVDSDKLSNCLRVEAWSAVITSITEHAQNLPSSKSSELI